MSMNLSGFDANAVQPQESRDPLPANWYKCVILASEEKPTKAQTGSYLQLQLQVIEGDYSGRSVFDRLNLDNPNQTAVDIAQRTLSSICRATGVMTPTDSSQLHDIPIMVKVAIRPASGGYDAGNDIKEYAAADNVQAAPQPAKASGGTPPWKR